MGEFLPSVAVGWLEARESSQERIFFEPQFRRDSAYRKAFEKALNFRLCSKTIENLRSSTKELWKILIAKILR